MKRTPLKMLAVLLGPVLLSAGGGVAAAQEQPPPTEGATPGAEATPAEPELPTWSVGPAGENGLAERTYFVYTLAPGARLVDTVAVSNLDDEPLTLAIYPADAYNTSGDGGFALRNPEDPKEGVAAWVRTGVNEYTIAPGMSAQIPFELDIPADATPGDHAGAIIAAKADLEEGGGTSNLDVRLRRRVGSRIYVRVEGPLDPALSVKNLHADGHQAAVPFITGRGGVDVSYTVENTGNARLTPKAQVELVGPFGVVVHRSEAEQLPELLPGGSVDRTAHIDGLPPLGRLSLRVKVTSDEAATRSAHTLWAFPWAWLAIAVVAVLLWRWRRRRWRNLRERAEAAESEPEKQPA
jgi:hypothetical protein